MSELINPRVVDLSHWNPANDYVAVKDAGIVGVIYKATEGVSYIDNTYVQQQHAAKAAGLKWGAYHLANGRDVGGQVANFLRQQSVFRVASPLAGAIWHGTNDTGELDGLLALAIHGWRIRAIASLHRRHRPVRHQLLSGRSAAVDRRMGLGHSHFLISVVFRAAAR